MTRFPFDAHRRQVLRLGAATLAAPLLPALPPLLSAARAATPAPASPDRLILAESWAALLGDDRPETRIWGYNGVVPGPILRARQGDRLAFTLDNQLDRPSSVHCHGIRLPNDQDGVPHMTQEPVGKGETFDYGFVCPDAGTYWYHPHLDSARQMGHGAKGLLIVDEPDPYPVDRDLAWMLDDWRIGKDLQVTDDFDDLHMAGHNGRMGNLPTTNGLFAPTVSVTPGERLRLRLCNGANGRIMAPQVRTTGDVWLIALDGHPLANPKALVDSVVFLGPGMRADLVVDIPDTADPANPILVVDAFDPEEPRPIAALTADAKGRGKGTANRPAPPPLPANALPEPDLEQANELEMVLQGGAMGRLSQAEVNGRMLNFRAMVDMGLVWAVNGRVPMAGEEGHPGEPLARLTLGRTARYTIRNDTSWAHPIHLHGMAFKVIERSQALLGTGHWADTVLVAPQETVTVAFVADNPGSWMFHCHILSHMDSGMMGHIEVA